MRKPTGTELAMAAGLGLAAAAVGAALRPRYGFFGRVALVTGGSRGLGLVLARHLAAAGARVAVCARDAEDLDRAVDDIARLGSFPVASFVCDVSDADQVESMVQQIRSQRAPVEILINNAGVIKVGPLPTITTGDVRESLDIHVMGPWHTMRAVLPNMLERGEGRIVNISSIGGRVALPHLSSYCAGKFGLAGLSRAMQMELAGTGVRITTVCPGLMRTGSPPRASFKGRHRAEYAWFSIADSLPGVTLSADRAARRILAACSHGTAQVTLGMPAKVLAAADALAPSLTSTVLGGINRLLPGDGGIGDRALEGRQSTSAWSPSVLTALSDQASLENNEAPEPAGVPAAATTRGIHQATASARP